ncbi:MAG: methyltransferase domain-containing protein [Dehalococcoidales bacterium]|nr:methyltransferase domain-containing protein [Dehalococcoidales bacterium]
MAEIPESITSLSQKYGFNRSSGYNQAWMFDNSMGPNPLWLVEWLTRDMELSEDMVVLDMGCGKSLTSIFLSREFGCIVFANDLWISPDENLVRIKEHKLSRKVFPLQAEAHALPYAKDFFDAVVCVDAFNYFGTDDEYLNYFLKYVKPGGQIGMVVPGWAREKEGRMPPGLEAFPAGEFASFHTCEWWRRHFEQYDTIDIEKCEYLPGGKDIWKDSTGAMIETKRILRSADGTSPDEMQKELDFWGGDLAFLEADREDYSSLFRIIIRKKKEQAAHFRDVSDAKIKNAS